MNEAFSHIILVITAAALVYAAWTDLRTFKIRNELIIALVALFVIHSVASGRWIEAHWNVAVAFIAFLIVLIFYVRRAMGGGDVKLFTVAALWVGYRCAEPFALLLLIFAIIQAVAAKMGWIETKDQKRRVPFAPAVAAALVGTFLLGCLDEPPVRYVPYVPLGNERIKPEITTPSVPQSR